MDHISYRENQLNKWSFLQRKFHRKKHEEITPETGYEIPKFRVKSPHELRKIKHLATKYFIFDI